MPEWSCPACDQLHRDVPPACSFCEHVPAPGWSCGTCTFRNGLGASSCVVCGSADPARAAAPALPRVAPAAPRTPVRRPAIGPPAAPRRSASFSQSPTPPRTPAPPSPVPLPAGARALQPSPQPPPRLPGAPVRRRSSAGLPAPKRPRSSVATNALHKESQDHAPYSPPRCPYDSLLLVVVPDTRSVFGEHPRMMTRSDFDRVCLARNREHQYTFPDFAMLMPLVHAEAIVLEETEAFRLFVYARPTLFSDYDALGAVPVQVANHALRALFDLLRKQQVVDGFRLCTLAKKMIVPGCVDCGTTNFGSVCIYCGSVPYAGLQYTSELSTPCETRPHCGSFRDEPMVTSVTCSRHYAAVPPPGLTVKLRPYQAHAVDWMVRRETCPDSVLLPCVKLTSSVLPAMYYNDFTAEVSLTRCDVGGGMLASQMGMGKTVMLVSLMLINGVRSRPVGSRIRGLCHGGTLVVVPPILVGQWVNEIHRLSGGKLQICEFSAQKLQSRPRRACEAARYDVVVAATTLLSRMNHGTRLRWGSNTLFTGVFWHRVVYDEAHVSRFHADRVIMARNRWLATGTPKIGHESLELMTGCPFPSRSTVRPAGDGILRHTVTDQYLDGGDYLGLPPLHDFTVFVRLSESEENLYREAINRFVTVLRARSERHPNGRIESSSWKGYVTAVGHRLRDLVSHPSNLGGGADMAHWAEGIDNELWPRLAVQFREWMREGGWASRDSAAVHEVRFITFEEIPTFVRGARAAELQNELREPAPECSICMEELVAGGKLHPCTTHCGHLYCGGCATTVALNAKECPICRGALTSAGLRLVRMQEGEAAPAAEVDPADGEWQEMLERHSGQYGSRLRRVLAEVHAVREVEPWAKILFFVSGTRTRLMLTRMLNQSGITLQEMCQGASPGLRARSLNAFADDPECAALILPTTVASFGLNLTAANHIFFVDPPRNVAQSQQAVGRCWRIGQGRPVYVHRFVVEGTVESLIHSCLEGLMERRGLAHPEAAAAAAAACGDGRADRPGRGQDELIEWKSLLRHIDQPIPNRAYTQGLA
eukprot:TRINITY_DN3131_c0_g1_i1.p1 TRINITY_DN3131_c0_g1~~TRINITY_DN3131_c0_g1_i1.p1  ORF type:complete len:1065 (+),score=239.76 TRINITY_DN3131_c0_g1_i1:50-3196(+)